MNLRIFRVMSVLIFVALAAPTAPPAAATIVLFENVKLSLSKELDGLQSVKDYGDYVDGVSTGGYQDSFAKGNGWTPNVALDYSGGKDR